MEDFMKSNRRIGEVSWTKQRVVDAYDRLNHCSAGVDGTKKTLFALFFNHFLHLVHFLFCQLAASCYILQKLEHIPTCLLSGGLAANSGGVIVLCIDVEVPFI